MKTYKTQKKFLKDCKDGKFEYDGDIRLEFDLMERVDIAVRNIDAWHIKARHIIALDIKAKTIIAGNIDARDINAWIIITGNIDARNIKAWGISAWDIDAWDIDARHINAQDIKAENIDALDIDADNIDAVNINAKNINANVIRYHETCISCNNITCYSIKGRTKNSFHKCVNGKLIIKKKKNHENENI